MGRKPKASSGAASKGGSLPLLQQRLLLNRWMCQQLGYENFKALREQLREQREVWSNDGHSYFFYALRGTKGLKIAEDKLAEYDLRIKAHLDKMNRVRRPPVQLKYFQYLALLFTEIYLDRLFNEREELRRDLNQFRQKTGWDIPNEFTESDLAKLAFWMATGSGKTLIMHINLWQYLHYSAGKWSHDNILLITPNEGLSRQHLEEFRKSGISARHYGSSEVSLFGASGDEPVVTVIEITKLIVETDEESKSKRGKQNERRRGGGLSVEVDAFGSNNLLFVDEGHRGASGEVWRLARAKLAEKGFTFEYSATFGQIVNGADAKKRPALLEEYAKSILFDYSYPHFYADGYGKDYFILNLKDKTKTFNEWIMLGNLLSFYEQCLVYDTHTEDMRSYNLEKPLWVFVGHSVTGGSKKEDDESLTDVQEIVCFFDSFLKEKEKWTQRIKELLAGQSGLKDSSNEDSLGELFSYLREQNLFSYLREQDKSAEEIYSEIVRRVFRANPGEALRVVELKNAPGEIGLRVGDKNPYCGVINIGNVRGLMERFRGQQIKCEEEHISGSLFDCINSADSPVNLLIGSRKFMEGWDSFRVASMGLMNIGKGEGAQIIQLFGRGVRLWGKERSLKRSRVVEPDSAPRYVELLETLNVFGIRADYMDRFREYLKNEGVTEFEEVVIPVRVQEEFLQRGLQVLRLPDGKTFVDSETVVLTVDKDIRITLDLRPQLEIAQSDEGKEMRDKVSGSDQAESLKTLIPLLDWERIYFDLLEFKRVKGLHNLSFTLNTLRQIAEEGDYTVLCPDSLQSLCHFSELRRGEDIVIGVLRKYTAAFYDRRRKEWERQHLQISTLTRNDPNLRWNERNGSPYYTLKIARQNESQNESLLETIRELRHQIEQLCQQDLKDFPNINIYFDRHLYQPLLLANQGIDTITPPGLNEGEAKFVRDLRDYLQQDQDVFQGKEVFLLRNLTRGKGIGFFDAKYGETPYPDFILWVLEDGIQWIIFIEPHGLRMTQDGFDDPKIRLHKELEQLCECKNYPVKITSFVISTSKYEEVSRVFGSASKDEFLKHQVVFQEDADYIAKMFQKLGIIPNDTWKTEDTP